MWESVNKSMKCSEAGEFLPWGKRCGINSFVRPFSSHTIGAYTRAAVERTFLFNQARLDRRILFHLVNVPLCFFFNSLNLSFFFCRANSSASVSFSHTTGFSAYFSIFYFSALADSYAFDTKPVHPSFPSFQSSAPFHHLHPYQSRPLSTSPQFPSSHRYSFLFTILHFCLIRLFLKSPCFRTCLGNKR